MIDIRPLAQLDHDAVRRLITGYTSHARYHITRSTTSDGVIIAFERRPLPEPYTKRYDHLGPETMAFFESIVAMGCSYEVYLGDERIGIAIAEPRRWNRSLYVLELHIAGEHQRMGIGAKLMEVLVEKSREAGLRTIVCETQNTNVPAIDFYHKVGFTIEGTDLSYYSNNDYPDGEIAIFMKRRLT